VTHLEKVIAGETSAVTYTEKVITGEAPPITHLQRVIAGVESPVTHLEYVWAGGSPTPTEHEYTGVVPYTFTANGSPLMAWRISGNTVQSTTPTPDNPIMPEGTGERTGNLFGVNRLPSNTWTIDDKYYIDGAVGDSKSSIRPDTVDASISNIGDLTVTARSYYGAGFVVAVTPNTTYTISFTTDTAVPSSKSIATITYVNADEDFLNYITIYSGTTSVAFTTPNTAYYILITFRYASNTITYSDIMLNEGSTALPYEPYGYKIPISCGGTVNGVYIGANPLRKALDGTAVDELSSNGTLTQRVDADGSVLPVPVITQIDTPTIPTVNGSNTFDVDTTVKPSEVYIKYKGV
jgi:hypothetical protein